MAVSGLAVWAVLGEVTHLGALPALDVRSRAWLGAVFRIVPFLLAVLASKEVGPFLGAIASTMAFLFAVNTADLRLVINLDGLLAMLANVTNHYISTS